MDVTEFCVYVPSAFRITECVCAQLRSFLHTYGLELLVICALDLEGLD